MLHSALLALTASLRLLCSAQAVCAVIASCSLWLVSSQLASHFKGSPCAAVQARESRVAQTPPANVDMLRHQFVMRSMETQPSYLQVRRQLDPDLILCTVA